MCYDVTMFVIDHINGTSVERGKVGPDVIVQGHYTSVHLNKSVSV